MTRSDPAAVTVAGDRLKLHRRSLSSSRRHRSCGAIAGDGATEVVNSAINGSLAIDPEAWIDDVVKQVDNQIDDHKKEPDHH